MRRKRGRPLKALGPKCPRNPYEGPSGGDDNVQVNSVYAEVLQLIFLSHSVVFVFYVLI